VKSNKQDHNGICFEKLPAAPDNPKLVFVWGHGWGQDHRALLPLAQSLKNLGAHYLIDFPGFGGSPQPTGIWDTNNYADATLSLLEVIKSRHPDAKIIWGCHSFGGRVGLQMASRAKSPIDGMVMLAAAGLKPQYPWWQKLHLWLKVRIFKTFKFLTKLGISEDWVIQTFTTGDYKSAGNMRKIFVKTVNEDLSAEARLVHCPVLLAYGENDKHAAPEMGERLARLISGAQFYKLAGHDHFTILTDGRHQIASLVSDFLEKHFRPL